jgi:hypothetical protein
MSRGNRIFTQTDVTRAVKGAMKAGLSVRRFEIDRNGRILVVTGHPEEAVPAEASVNEWDGVVQ